MHRHGAEFFVKVDGWLVPIEHRPFQSATLPFFGYSCDVTKQSVPEAASAKRFVDKEILDIDPRQTEKR
jgi:hypothetical protein